MAAKELLAVAEAAEYLNVTVRWMRRSVDERRIAYVKLGAHVRFRRSDLDAYVAAQLVEAHR